MSLKNIISQQLGIKDNQILSTLNLLSDGATIPFISRYRKEATGGLDEVQIANIDDLNFIAKHSLFCNFEVNCRTRSA